MPQEREYDYAVYATQGGGLARKLRKSFIFVEAPDGMGLNVGDTVPEQWDIVPANDLAREEISSEEHSDPSSFDEPLSEEERGYIRAYGIGKF